MAEGARPACRADALRLGELCQMAMDEVGLQRGGSLLVGDLLDGGTAQQALEAAFDDPDAAVVAGSYDEAVMGVGIAHVSGVPMIARIDVLYVESGARAVGVGQAILSALTHWASARGCRGIDAVALPGSRQSKSFFETNGMVARSLVMHRPLP